MLRLPYLFYVTAVLSLLSTGCDSQSKDIAENDWRVIQIAGTSATQSSLEKLTLSFEEDQKVTGFAGCNEFRGGAVYNEQQIKFSTLYTDNERCDDANLERRYLQNLENGARYTYHANKLAIQDKDGNILIELEKI